MKLTQKDKEFLERLCPLMEEKALQIELAEDGYRRLVLRRNYGDRIETVFGMSRQGVRWRFQRIFNDMYVNAYLSILSIESYFGPELRLQAMAIARQRFEWRQKARKMGQIEIPRRQPGVQPVEST